MRPTKFGALLAATLFAIVFATLFATVANADVVRAPPTCPPGSRGVSTHGAVRCAESPCTADESCPTGNRCVPYRVCTRPVEVFEGGREGRFHVRRAVVNSCPQRELCRASDTPPETTGMWQGAPRCSNANYCVPAARAPSYPAEVPTGTVAPRDPETPPPTSSNSDDPSGCHVGSQPGSAAWLLALVLAARVRRPRLP